MSFFLVLAFAATALCYAIFTFQSQTNNFKKHGIPHFNIFANLWRYIEVIVGVKHLTEVLDETYYYDKSAKYVGGFLLDRPIIMVRDLDLAMQVGVKNFDHFTDRLIHFHPEVDAVLAKTYSGTKGDRWREARRIMTPSFTTARIREMFDLVDQCSQDLLEHLRSRDLSMIDLKDLCLRFSYDATCSASFGLTLNCIKNPDNQFFKVVKPGHDLADWGGTIRFIINLGLPKLFSMIRWPVMDSESQVAFNATIADIVESRKRDGISRPDMIQFLINNGKKSDKKFDFGLVDITGQAFNFFFGGTEAMWPLIYYMVYGLTINSDVQIRLRQEIDDMHRENGGKLTYENLRDGMPFLEAACKEASRMAPTNFLVDRACTKKYELPPAKPGAKPLVMNVGDWIVISAISMQYDPQYFEEPERFNPDRYFKKIVNTSDHPYMAFSLGQRQCPATRLTMIILKMFTYHLVLNYNLVPNHKTPKKIEYKKGAMSLGHKEPIYVTLEAR